MSLHVYDQIEQGSEQWHAARRGIITASVVGQFITAKTIKPASNDYSRAMFLQLVAERITDYTEPTFTSGDMERGNFSEGLARDIYSEHYAPAVEVGFMVRELNGHRVGYSPDGTVGTDGLIEVKNPRQKKHLATIVSGKMPLEHMAQVQCGLLISGREWLDFISYSGGMPMFVKRILPDPRWFDAIFETVNTFEIAAAQIIGAYYAATLGMPATERVEEYEEIELKL